jgi:hypothetical protein
LEYTRLCWTITIMKRLGEKCPTPMDAFQFLHLQMKLGKFLKSADIKIYQECIATLSQIKWGKRPIDSQRQNFQIGMQPRALSCNEAKAANKSCKNREMKYFRVALDPNQQHSWYERNCVGWKLNINSVGSLESTTFQVDHDDGRPPEEEDVRVAKSAVGMRRQCFAAFVTRTPH